MKKYLKTYIIIYILSLILLVFLPVNQFLLNEYPKDKFSEILSILLNVLSILFGTIVSVSTLFLGLTNRNEIKSIIQADKGKLLYQNIANSIFSSALCTLCIVLLSMLYDVFSLMFIKFMLALMITSFLHLIYSSNIMIRIILLVHKNIFNKKTSKRYS